MNPATPNDPKSAAGSAPAGAPAGKITGHHLGTPIPARFAPFPGGKPAGAPRTFPTHNARPHISPGAMRQQRHGRHDG